MKILFTITLDCECDKSYNWRSSNPLTFNNIIYGIPDIIQAISDEYSLPPTYLFSNEVLENRECVESLSSLEGEYEFGTHLHGDYIEPLKSVDKYDGTLTQDFQGHYPEIIEFQKLKNLTELFCQSFGYYPRSFRAGRFGIGKNTFRNLAKLNYNVDTSVTPNQILRHPIKDQDFINESSNYFFPHIDNTSQNKLLEIPVSIYSPRIRNKWLSLNKSTYSEFVINRFLKSYWVRPSYSTLDQMKYAVSKLCSSSSEDTIVINLMYHSMEVVVGASPYVLNKSDLEKFLTRYRNFLEYIKNIGGIGMTLSQVYDYISCEVIKS